LKMRDGPARGKSYIAKDVEWRGARSVVAKDGS
jgi:hypothetical protein